MEGVEGVAGVAQRREDGVGVGVGRVRSRELEERGASAPPVSRVLGAVLQHVAEVRAGVALAARHAVGHAAAEREDALAERAPGRRVRLRGVQELEDGQELGGVAGRLGSDPRPPSTHHRAPLRR